MEEILPVRELSKKKNIAGELVEFLKKKQRDLVWFLKKRKGYQSNVAVPPPHESLEANRLPEFEEHTLHVESNGPERYPISINPYEKGQEKIQVKAKVNQEGEIEIIEYLDGPEKGEQLFITYDSFVKYACAYKGCTKEVLEQKYLPTKEKLQLLAGNPGEESEQYQQFHATMIKGKKLPGYYIPRGTKLGRRGSYLMIWLAGGKQDATFKDKMRETEEDSRSYGFSGWLLK